MDLKILLFGITRDIIGDHSFTIRLNEGGYVGDLKKYLYAEYPEMKKLRSLLIAVNNEYAPDDLRLSEKDEIALIPPVSGG
ncbi:hypothetical protein C900_04396 [Fulvivirga imtechensis AK7]|uniref:Molybdopterin synthase sulfur carrier subunit n=1 Tax=Fulvivirga imtechensis AK7 TaxID=1237149 RepID=L8JM66_9BACT|nr:MoaD/ThiS family protein [Fulvivirga imtechensis]ELR70026.1 hypothetical protein C900_04396 [Fulvivirga imtechensis AK7]